MYAYIIKRIVVKWSEINYNKSSSLFILSGLVVIS